jgi:hypothetical protein
MKQSGVEFLEFMMGTTESCHTMMARPEDTVSGIFPIRVTIRTPARTEEVCHALRTFANDLAAHAPWEHPGEVADLTGQRRNGRAGDR